MIHFKKIAAILLTTLYVASCNAQTFLKYFAIDSVATLAYSMVEKDSFLYVCGVVVDTSNYAATKSYFAKFDGQGNMLWNKTYRPNRFVDFRIVAENGLINTSDGGFAAAGYAKDTNGIYYVCFTKFDSSGNLLFYNIYAPDIPDYKVTYGFRIIEYDSAYFILGDVQLPDYYIAQMLIKVGLSGNLEFIKTYQNLPLLYSTLHDGFCTLPGDKLLITEGRSDENLNYWQIQYATCFTEVDTGGNVSDQYFIRDGNTRAFQNTATAYDGNFLSCGSYYQLRGREQPAELDINYLVKYDKYFDTIWTVKNGDLNEGNTFTDFEQDKNNNIIVGGQNAVGSIGYAMMEDVIYKIDSGGNILWYRHYMVPTGLDPDYSSNYLSDIDLLPNGGIAVVGSWESATTTSPLYFLQVGVIMRLDSNGCLGNNDCGLTTDITEPPQNAISKSEVVRVFPNPNNGIFTVNAITNLPAATTFDIYDGCGRKLHSQLLFNNTNLINANYLSAGIYFYKISNGLINVGEGKFVIEK